MEKPHEEASWKTNAETEVQSMVSVPIHQDTSTIPPMTTPVMDLTTMQSDSPLPTLTTTTSIITTTTYLPPPPQPRQSIADPILVSHIGELEQHMTDLIQNNLALEERLDKQGARLYNLENLNIPHKAHEVHNFLYEALQKSLELDYSNQCLTDQEEARKKKRKKCSAPRTPSGSPPSPPPYPPPPAGASGAPGISGTSGSSQLPPLPPYPSTGASGSAQQVGTQELSPTDSLMQDDSIPDEHVHLSDDEDSENDHLPKADSRQDWWKPLPEEKRPTTPEPAWTIPSSNVSDIENNWASTLISTYETPAENSLLAKTGDMTTFMKCVVRIRAYSRYMDDYLSEIVLQRANFQEYTIAEKDFKNLYHSDFEDLHLLLLQGHLDLLPSLDKWMLSTAIKLWTRNLVIRQRVKDFQLGIESYQTWLNLTKPGWDATGYEFKHDYSIIESP
ncbi:hypothetical protein Tco_0728208 [Tanacetum coccineum]|uniref:Uncharacterized protein n=1 Tax=Tanacetum coccineum TaxID=301880 RepID=A0ABQ4YN49_9ASTR